MHVFRDVCTPPGACATLPDSNPRKVGEHPRPTDHTRTSSAYPNNPSNPTLPNFSPKSSADRRYSHLTSRTHYPTSVGEASNYIYNHRTPRTLFHLHPTSPHPQNAPNPVEKWLKIAHLGKNSKKKPKIPIRFPRPIHTPCYPILTPFTPCYPLPTLKVPH